MSATLHRFSTDIGEGLVNPFVGIIKFPANEHETMLIISNNSIQFGDRILKISVYVVHYLESPFKLNDRASSKTCSMFKDWR